MATVTASKYGTINYQGDSSFSATRTAATGSSASNQSGSSDEKNGMMYYASGKGDEWEIRRSYLAFNVSSYATGYTITNLKLYYKPTATGSGTYKIAIIKQTAQGNANADLTTSDYYTPLDYTVDYAANNGTLTWSDSTSLSYFDLNATAISAFTSNYLKLAIVEYNQDYGNSAPGFTMNLTSYWDPDDTVPYLSFTATPTGYGNDIIGVSSSDISKVIDVATADISQVIGV